MKHICTFLCLLLVTFPVVAGKYILVPPDTIRTDREIKAGDKVWACNDIYVGGLIATENDKYRVTEYEASDTPIMIRQRGLQLTFLHPIVLDLFQPVCDHAMLRRELLEHVITCNDSFNLLVLNTKTGFGWHSTVFPEKIISQLRCFSTSG